MNQKTILKKALSLILSGSLIVGSSSTLSGCGFSDNKNTNISRTDANEDNTDVNENDLDERVNNLINNYSIEEIIQILSENEEYSSIFQPLLQSQIKVDESIINYEEYLNGINQILTLINMDKKIKTVLGKEQAKKYGKYFLYLELAIVEVMMCSKEAYNIDVAKVNNYEIYYNSGMILVGQGILKNAVFNYDNIAYDIKFGNNIQYYAGVSGAGILSTESVLLQINNIIKKLLFFKGVISNDEAYGYDSIFDIELDEQKIEFVESYMNNQEKQNNFPTKNVSYNNRLLLVPNKNNRTKI